MSTSGHAVLIDRAVRYPAFNYEFLIFLLLAGVISIFFLLYLNRIFASIVSYGIRTWTWHQHRIFIDIGALQISLLGGRIFFTGLRYHGSNETFLIQQGYVTWRYWLRRVREADIHHASGSSTETTAPGKDKNAKLPCRINVDLIGVEWFVYNRSPAYDSIITGLSESLPATSSSNSWSARDEQGEGGVRSRQPRSDNPSEKIEKSEHGSQSPLRKGVQVPNCNAQSEDNLNHNTSRSRADSSTCSRSLADSEAVPDKTPDLPFVLQLFPIHIDCQKVAAVIGNENTRGILVFKADTVGADVDASETQTVDPYRQVFRVQFKHPVVNIKENEDFKSDQASRATGAAQDTQPCPKPNAFRRSGRKLLRILRRIFRHCPDTSDSVSPESRDATEASTSHVPGSHHWQGLSRYLDDQEQDDKARWSSVEYAAETNILDCPAGSLTIYWDVVSKVTAHARRHQGLDPSVRINGEESPAWGMHFTIKGGAVNYGPWADRRRADLQRVFFPYLSKDASPATPLDIGAWRVPTKFKLFIELEDTVALRVPFREESKNWRWRGQEPQLKQFKPQRKRNRSKKDAKSEAASIRPIAWLEVKVAPNATVDYSMDMLASSAGYSNHINIDLPSTELRSTVNQDILWKSGAQRISCDLSNPLSWNSPRLWKFDIDSDNLKLFILRDHIFLLIDLINDWSSGPPVEYLVFTPFKYLLNLKLRNLQLYLNVNDANIIDNPTAMDDNAYLILSSPLLTAETSISIDTYRPEKNSIPFDVRADALDLAFHAPQWNTQSAFKFSNEVGQVQSLVLGGRYHYHATTSPANTDSLVLNVHGKSPYAYLHGYVVRCFLLLKDNYFGDFVHFRTLDEYQEQLQLKNQHPDAEPTASPPYRKSNDLDVILSIQTDNPRFMLPTNMYTARRYVQGELASLSVDLRFTNYYMDMELDLSPLSLSLGSPQANLDSPTDAFSGTQLFIDGLRVYGHRLFGLPPTEPTYLCNWDVSVGAVSGDCTADFIAAVANAGMAFDFTFDDVENALTPYSSIMFDDVTFAQVAVESVRIWLHVDEAAFLFSTDAINVTLNDWARSHYSKRVNITIPNIQISCVNSESAARHKARATHPVETYAYLKTDVQVALIGRKLHFADKRKLQQELVQREDQRTNRTPFLLIPECLDNLVPELVDPPAQCAPVPPLPVPEVESDNISSRSAAKSRKSHHLSRQSSFLSLSGSSTHSVRRSRSRLGPHPKSKPGSQRLDDSFTAIKSRPSFTKRDTSASSGCHSNFYGVHGDNTSNEPLNQASPAVSSQYYEPHFALKGVEPDTREISWQNTEGVEERDFLSKTVADLGDIDPHRLSEEHTYSSVLLEFPTGLTGFFSPSAIRHTASLVSALQPTDAEDVLDCLQINAMTKIFESKKRKAANGSITDILLRLPKANIRFLNSSTLDSPDPTQKELDQYDLVISNVGLVTRTVTDWAGRNSPEHKDSRTSLHLCLGSAEVSASERLSSLQEPQAAMMVQIDNVMVSVGAKDITYFDADIGSVVGSTASGKIEYLAALIHRTGSLATELEYLIKDTMGRHDDRLKYFLYRLLEEGQSTNDPSFLIRPSAVLRSAPEHLRTFDSWKLAMRLRQIWSTMEARNKLCFNEDFHSESRVVPPDAADLVVAAFQRWRSWDLENVPAAILLQNVFGPIEAVKKPVAIQHPLLGACRLAEMQLVLDPGPKENRVSLVDATLRVKKKMPTDELLPGTSYSNGPLTIITLRCNEAAVNMNWELCELVEDILRLYNQNRDNNDQKPNSAKKAQSQPSSPESVHVVLEVIRGSVEVETVNLKAKSLSHGVTTSFLFNSDGGSSKLSSVVMKCNVFKSEVRSHTQLLGVFRLREPSIFVSHELQETTDASTQTIKSAASSRGLQLAIKQEPIALMEIFNLLLRDEISQILHLQKQFPTKTKPKEPVKIRDRLSCFRLSITMFLDKYSISMPLLQSLTYKITGVVARAACAANFGKEIIFDFDIKENSHEMQIDVRNEPRSISLLQIPPINGRVTSQIQNSEHVLTVLSSVELMQLDASAVYSLLAALNRPQISSAIEEIQEQSKVIQWHITDTFGSKEPEPPQQINNASLSLVYNVHLTLAGLRVSAITPLNSQTAPFAQVLFFKDKFHLQASNRHEPKGLILRYPELHLNLKQFGFDIRRGQRDAMKSCGSFGAGVTVSASSRLNEDGKEHWSFGFRCPDLTINLSPETISTAVGVLGYLRGKIKDLDTSRELDYLRKLRKSKPRITLNDDQNVDDDDQDILESVLGVLVYNFELQNIRICWIVANEEANLSSKKEDLVLSIKLIQFGTRTMKSARLTIENFQLQTVPPGQDKNIRSLHSALLPEIIFNIALSSTPTARRMAFQATGQSLDLRLTSGFILPAANLANSISLSARNIQNAYDDWGISTGVSTMKSEETLDDARPWSVFGKKRLESLLVDAAFDGAVVHVSSKRNFGDSARASKSNRPSLAGKYGQFNTDDTGSGAVLRSPGLAWKVELRDNGQDDPTLSGEIMVHASSNTLYPSVVPLIMDMMSSVKEVVSDDAEEAPLSDPKPVKLKPEKSGEEENILTADPSAVLGRMKLNLGLRICRQEFSLSCQPIARVAATACFDSIYFTANTVTSPEHGNFFAISATFRNLQAAVQHVYSRESTGSFDVETITLSFMNSKHVSGTSGVSAILNLSPMKVSVNAKQVQDFLLFREIWYPEELRRGSSPRVAKLVTETSQGHLVQRYQQVAATAAFPWTATISITALDVSVDLGQAIGKSVFEITNFWVSSKKTSDWEQNLCLGFSKIGINCTGRLSGFVALQDFKLRTSIQWPKREQALNETPLVQASIGFNAFRLKAAFDYQAFLVADITSLEFLMYNVRDNQAGRGDRLVAIFDGEAVQVFGTTTSTAQAVALYQAIKKLIQERRGNFEASLRDIEKFMRRKSSVVRFMPQPSDVETMKSPQEQTLAKSPISLDTDVVVTLKALNLGVFPSTFSDHQVFKIEAMNAYARFAAGVERGRIHSLLKMTLGQLRIGLAGVRNAEAPRTLSEISVEDVVQRVTGSRGGTILKVPRVSAMMETWQTPESNTIDYIFKSAFEGKVEVGWNYSRISYIRGMWANHSKSLQQTWGKELSMAAVKITGVPEVEGEQKDGEQQKITAEVNVPQSKYNYIALEPAIIETPQLRDMGEATPPLEWIGLHRERLPNLTHQIVIVSLLELAGEVEDAYSRILGAS